MDAPRSPATIRWNGPNPMLICATCLKEFPAEEMSSEETAATGRTFYGDCVVHAPLIHQSA
jgi:hypothetical protein